MKKVILSFLTLMAISAGVNAQNLTIPDANFKAYLVGNTAINTNGDTEIQLSEASTFNGQIDCSYQSISNLTGIRAFTEITELYTNNNSLSSLDVTQNTKLTRLYCQNNVLNSIDVSQNPDLAIFQCSNNSLSNLDVTQNTLLTNLLFSNNVLTNIDLSQNAILTEIYCLNNSLSTLNVSQNNDLSILSCNNNSLTNLDVSQNAVLYYLYCNNNSLTSLDLSQNTDLNRLTFKSNYLTSIDLSQNLDLRRFDGSNNSLNGLLDLSLNTDLDFFNCSNNPLTNLNLKNGNNANFNFFNASSTPNLTCIQVDDATWSTTNWTNIDATASFSTNCAGGGVGINENSGLLSGVEIYPNPVQNRLLIAIEEGKITKTDIFDLSGKLVKPITNNTKSIYVSDLTKGIYLIKVATENNVITSRFIKQ